MAHMTPAEPPDKYSLHTGLGGQGSSGMATTSGGGGTAMVHAGPAAGPVGAIARAAAQDAGAEPLDQALSALKAVADALGIFPQTWQARTITEVGDMLVQEVARRDTLAAAGGTHIPVGQADPLGHLRDGNGHIPDTNRAEADRILGAGTMPGFRGGSIPPTLAAAAAWSGMAEESPAGRAVVAALWGSAAYLTPAQLNAIIGWAVPDGGPALCTSGSADNLAFAGYPASIHTRGGAVISGVAMHAAAAGEQLTILLGNGPPPRPWQHPSLPDPAPSPPRSGTEDRPLLYETNMYEELVAEWRRTADAEQVKAGELRPSAKLEIARRRGAATAWYRAANQLADVVEPLRTKRAAGEEHDDDPALD